jgi:hypothetical protein
MLQRQQQLIEREAVTQKQVAEVLQSDETLLENHSGQLSVDHKFVPIDSHGVITASDKPMKLQR